MQLNLTKPIVFFDIESTGVVVGKDKIIEICFFKVNPDQTTQEKQYLINPGCHIPEASTAIHGIKDSDVKTSPLFKDVAREIYTFIGESDLAGYNSNKFDVPMLVEEFFNAGVVFSIANRHCVDVMNIFHKMEQRNLKAAYKFYCGKNLENAHTATADTMATYEILLAQLDKYKGAYYEEKDHRKTQPIENNIPTLATFSKNDNWVDLVGHVAYNDKGQECINFGKYKNRPVEDIFKTDPSYFAWMMNADFPQSTKRVIIEIRNRTFRNI
jgi:DNA polymerase III, epsilon subunit and related 3''-5'' exonucleases